MNKNCVICNAYLHNVHHHRKFCDRCKVEKRKQYTKEHYQKNKERIDKKNKNWDKNNRERRREIARKSYYKRHDKELERRRIFRENNREKTRESSKKYRESEKGKIKRKEYLQKPHVKEAYAKYQRDNPDKVKKFQKKYVHSIKGRLRKLRRRAKEHNCINTLTDDDLKEIQKRDKVCVYCGEKHNLTFDHIVPLNKRGDSVKENIAVACDSCNKSKRDFEVIEWCNKKGYVVPEIVNKMKAR